YNDRNELTGSTRYTGTDVQTPNNPVTDQDFQYAYDAIGNRLNGVLPSDFRTAYEANALNQYDKIHSLDTGSSYSIPEVQRLSLNNDLTANKSFGSAIAISGNRAVIGAIGQNSGKGKVHIAEFDGTEWTIVESLAAPDG